MAKAHIAQVKIDGELIAEMLNLPSGTRILGIRPDDSLGGVFRFTVENFDLPEIDTETEELPLVLIEVEKITSRYV